MNIFMEQLIGLLLILLVFHFILKFVQLRKLTNPSIMTFEFLHNIQVDKDGLVTKADEDKVLRLLKKNIQTLPTYVGMLNQKLEDFQILLYYCTNSTSRENLIREMVDHELKTQSSSNRLTNESTEEEHLYAKFFTNISDRENIIKKLIMIQNTKIKELPNDKQTSEIEIIRKIIYNKAILDFFSGKNIADYMNVIEFDTEQEAREYLNEKNKCKI